MLCFTVYLSGQETGFWGTRDGHSYEPRPRASHEGWSLVWWSPYPELWGDGDLSCQGTSGAGADGSEGLAWHPGLWEVCQAPEGGQGWLELVALSGL